jgi:CubicO group peptidase (beta-lactamase class C family)
MYKLVALFLLVTAAVKVPAQSRYDKINKIVNKTVNGRTVFGLTLCVSKGDTSHTFAAGNLADTTSYFIASTTKLYVAAVIFGMEEKGMLKLNDPISQHLDAGIMDGLHKLNGKEHSREITVRQLLSHTSGLPDYFMQKDKQGKTLFDKLKKGNDVPWTFQETVAMGKEMTPKFAPGADNKAFYSDLNYQLLGKIIENTYHMELDEVFRQEIYRKLGLTHTYIYKDTADTRPADMYYGNSLLHIPLAMTSFKADGGIVSTAGESMLFLKAFFGGKLFSTSYISTTQTWRKIFAPLQYGVGMMKFELPAYFTGFRKMPFLVGHSGHSGAFQWYCPEKDTYYTGTVNQIGKPSISYKLLVKLLMVD